LSTKIKEKGKKKRKEYIPQEASRLWWNFQLPLERLKATGFPHNQTHYGLHHPSN